jgi:hypothetical protein
VRDRSASGYALVAGALIVAAGVLILLWGERETSGLELPT